MYKECCYMQKVCLCCCMQLENVYCQQEMLCCCTTYYQTKCYLQVRLLGTCTCIHFVCSQGGIIHNFLSRYHRDPRDLDEDEEAWFNDEEESSINDNPSPVTSPTGASPRFPSPLAPLASYSPRPATMPVSRMALPPRPSTTRTVSSYHCL